MAAQRLRRPLAGQPQQEGDLHVRGLAGGGGLHGGGVFVAVDEDQAGPANNCRQRGHRREQHRAVGAVDQRETPARQSFADTAMQRAHHLQQRALIDKPGRPAGRDRLRHYDIRG
jgi:hypothetical protein